MSETPHFVQAIGMPAGAEWIVMIVVALIPLALLCGIIYALYLGIRYLRIKIKESEDRESTK